MMTGIVVSKQMATLYELQTIYSYEDLMDLYDITVVNYNNELRARQAIEEEQKRQENHNNG